MIILAANANPAAYPHINRFVDLATNQLYLVETEADYAALPATIPAVAQKNKAIMEAIEKTLEEHMDTVAQADGWDDRKTCSLRAGYTGPWQAKGIAFGAWMDQCWVKAFEIQAAVEAGTRPIPTAEQVVAEMPVMVWP